MNDSCWAGERWTDEQDGWVEVQTVVTDNTKCRTGLCLHAATELATQNT